MGEDGDDETTGMTDLGYVPHLDASGGWVVSLNSISSPRPKFCITSFPIPPSPTLVPTKMFTQSVVLVFSAYMAGYLALAQVYPDGQSPNNQAYNLPADGETLLAQALSLSFSCDSREYGYYADVSNNCQIFHICLPIEDDAGSIIETAQWSFICGNGTIFDQQSLSCNYETDSVPCDQAESLYNLIEFGKIESDY
eukprot:snap_masked-scaffold1097_size63051-processed-gene-0.10 protein:Tk07124 transcript:snap_masked-scaffold1097_size63051-processed-gene-0.10-mRNA-1 annotation:"cuticle protein"